MDVSKILAEIDAKILSLQQARSAIVSLDGIEAEKPRRGRPKGSTNKKKSTKRKRNLSPEGRARIAEAVKKRWADRRKKAQDVGKKS
jgi:hypothetical protein